MLFAIGALSCFAKANLVIDLSSVTVTFSEEENFVSTCVQSDLSGLTTVQIMISQVQQFTFAYSYSSIFTSGNQIVLTASELLTQSSNSFNFTLLQLNQSSFVLVFYD